LKEFYTEYISEGDKPLSREHGIALLKIRQEYCTQRLFNELDKYSKIMVIDYDPFTNAQDFDINWLKTLKINKDSIRNDMYHVSIWFDYEKVYSNIKLYIVKEGESYKIDNIDSIKEIAMSSLQFQGISFSP
jgi:hypothetical protein